MPLMIFVGQVDFVPNEVIIDRYSYEMIKSIRTLWEVCFMIEFITYCNMLMYMYIIIVK